MSARMRTRHSPSPRFSTAATRLYRRPLCAAGRPRAVDASGARSSKPEGRRRRCREKRPRRPGASASRCLRRNELTPRSTATGAESNAPATDQGQGQPAGSNCPRPTCKRRATPSVPDAHPRLSGAGIPRQSRSARPRRARTKRSSIRALRHGCGPRSQDLPRQGAGLEFGSHANHHILQRTYWNARRQFISPTARRGWIQRIGGDKEINFTRDGARSSTS